MRLSCLFAVSALLLAGCIQVYPPSAEPTPKPTDGAPSSQQAKDEQEDEKPYKEWAEVTKDAEVVEGLFTLYKKREDLYWSIQPNQLDRDYLVVAQYSSGIGDLFFLGGLPLRRDVVRFERSGDHVHVVLPPMRTYAEAGTGMAQAVELSFGSSVLESLEVESVHDSTGAILVDATDLLISDWVNLTPAFQAFLGNRANLSEDRSALRSVKAFPTNVEIEVDLTYEYDGDVGLPTVPDSRYVPIGVHYSWLELPDPPMRQRLADDRVGHFLTARKNFSRDTLPTYFERYVNRWPLEKADSGAEISEPVEPIVFYLDHTIPERWRPYVKKGIEAWNAAFEQAGFRDAIVARDAPDDPDWSAEDARYNTVRWITTHRSTFAIGPSDADPRTGELLNADILVTASWVQAWLSDWEQIAAPTEMIRERERLAEVYRKLPPEQAARLCFYGQGLAREAAFVRSVLTARGVIGADDPVPESFIGGAIVDLVMHEVGHTLGLRHNFKASSAIPHERLQDESFTRRNGISASVMDYNPVNVAVERERQGQYWMEGVGPWDRWVIEYAYTPIPEAETPEEELPALREIAARGATDPLLAYGSDEDALFGPAGVDPATQRYDLGDPLRFARDRAQLIAEVMPALERRILPDGESYYRLRGAFNSVLSEKWRGLLYSARIVGGLHVQRLHRGAEHGHLPFEPVPAERQREALEFVLEDGFGPDAFAFEPELLNKLMPSRWLHWGTAFFIVPVDYPIHEVVLGIQSSVLGTMLHPITLTRILDTEVKVAGQDAFTLEELFGGLTRSIWSEVHADRINDIGSYRRGIQRRYTEMLANILLEPLAGTPEDARSLARLHLRRLGDRIDAALESGVRPNDYTRAHLEETRARIARTLNAEAAVEVSG